MVDLDQAKAVMERFTAKQRGRATRKIRKEAGLSLGKLGALTGVSGAMISRFERGLNDLSLPTFARLQDAIISVLSEKRAADKLTSLRKLMPPERFASFPWLKFPDVGLVSPANTHERVKDRLIRAQGELIRALTEEVELRGERETEQDRKISDLEKRIAELRDLLGLETAAVVTQDKVTVLREKLTVAGMRKENSEADSDE